MKIDPERLRTLREQRGLTRLKLAERSKISDRTIQRLEKEPQKSKKTQEHTLNSLAQALGVKTGVLTSELPLPESDKTPADNPDRVQIGAQIAPNTRLAYDLIKRRYGVSTTEIINMAPLFFVLLAEGSLAQRREKLQEIEETYDRLYQIDVSWLSLPPFYEMVDHMCGGVAGSEADSIDKADLFGKYLNNDFIGAPFDPSTENPFVHYLQNLADELDIFGVVNVDKGDLNFRSQYKFPYYDICREELDYISNGSSKARRTLETGHVRLSEIPEELMAEDAGERRVKWLEDKLPGIYDILDGDSLAKIVSTDPKQDLKQNIEDMESKHPDLKQKIMESQKVDSQKTNSETEKEGDDK